MRVILLRFVISSYASCCLIKSNSLKFGSDRVSSWNQERFMQGRRVRSPFSQSENFRQYNEKSARTGINEEYYFRFFT